MKEEWPKDGATLRRKRLMDMLTHIAGWPHDEKPCSEEALQVFMLLKHGNRRTTVLEYLRELILADILIFDKRRGGYKLKRTWEQTMLIFAAIGE
jgi:hypothetical protein